MRYESVTNKKAVCCNKDVDITQMIQVKETLTIVGKCPCNNEHSFTFSNPQNIKSVGGE